MKHVNKIKIATIVCWGVIAVSMIGLATWAITGSLFGIPTGIKLGGLNFGGIESLFGKYELCGTQAVPVGGVDSFDISWVAGNVTVTPYDGAEIEFKEYAQRELHDDEQMYITVSGGTVTVKFIEKNRMSKMPQKQLEIFIPRGLCESIDMFDADATSADISVTGISAARLTASSTSGNIGLDGVRADYSRASSTSGNVTISGSECQSLDIGSTSGNLKVTDSSGGTLSVDSTSGDHRLYCAFEDLDLDSTSGNITVENGDGAAKLHISTASGTLSMTGAFSTVKAGSISGNMRVTSADVPEELEISTTSGDVTVTIPDEGGIAIKHSTVSGSIKSDIPMTLGSGEKAFDISTVSGNVRILAL